MSRSRVHGRVMPSMISNHVLVFAACVLLAGCDDTALDTLKVPRTAPVGVVQVASVGDCVVYRGTDDVGQTFYLATGESYETGVACQVVLAVRTDGGGR